MNPKTILPQYAIDILSSEQAACIGTPERIGQPIVGVGRYPESSCASNVYAADGERLCGILDLSAPWLPIPADLRHLSPEQQAIALAKETP